MLEITFLQNVIISIIVYRTSLPWSVTFSISIGTV